MIEQIQFEHLKFTNEPLDQDLILKYQNGSKLSKKILSTRSTSEGRVVTYIEYSFSPFEEFRGGSLPGSGMNSFQRIFFPEWQTYNWYRISLNVTDIEQKSFSLQLPVLYFDGNPINIPEIEVELVNEFVLSSLLC